MTDDVGILDLVHDSVWVCDAETGAVLRWNRASVELYGIAAADALGKDVFALLGDEPDARTELLAKGAWSGEARRRSAAGVPLVVNVRWQRQLGADGAMQIVECGQDLTGRRATEASLQYSEYRYRNLFSAMAAAFLELDFNGVTTILRRLRKAGVEDFAAHLRTHPEVVREMMRATRVLDVNEHCVTLFGNGKKEDLLATAEPFWPEESFGVYVAGILAGVAKKPSFSTETRLRKLDGTTFEALFTASYPPLVFERGIFVIGVIDITERKRAEQETRRNEERYRNLFHHMPIALAELDVHAMFARYAEAQANGVTDIVRWVETDADIDELAELIVCRQANEQAVKLFEGDAIDALRGPITWVWKPSPGTLRRVLAARLRGDVSYTEETRVATRTGKVIDVLYTMSYSKVLTDRATSVAAFVDIRERIQAEELIEQMQSEFAHAARVATLGELTASIAHEVNQPLSAILVTAATVQRWLAQDPPNLSEAVSSNQRIMRDARRAADIILRIRSMATKSDPEPAITAIGPAIEEAFRFLRYEIQTTRVDVALELASELPDVLVDRVQLQQVVVNLALNGLQAMRGQERRVLTVRTERAPDGMVRVLVEDSGPGIPDDQKNRLFTSFFTTKATGMGIGLRICRSIIEAHGGSITAANRPDGGAVIAFELPSAEVIEA